MNAWRKKYILDMSTKKIQAKLAIHVLYNRGKELPSTIIMIRNQPVILATHPFFATHTWMIL